MGATWWRRLGATLIACGGLGLARADDEPPLPPLPPSFPQSLASGPLFGAKSSPPAAPKETTKPSRPVSRDATAVKPTVKPAPAPESKPEAPSRTSTQSEKVLSPAEDDGNVDISKVDIATARIEVEARLKELPADTDKAATSASKALRAAFEERISWLDALNDARVEREKAENPKPTPEKLAADARSELERVHAVLAESEKSPDVLLPAVFKAQPTGSGKLAESSQVEMKEAIDAAQAELKDRTAKFEQIRADQSKKPGASLRAGRDKAVQHLAAIKARDSERADKAGSDAKSADAMRLAREKRLNAAWEQLAATETLKAKEASLALEARREPLTALNAQLVEADVQLGQRTLNQMKARFRSLAARQEDDLHREAADEQSKAAKSDDPLERYRAKRNAELLELEAHLVKSKSAYDSGGLPPTLAEQTVLANAAETDFSNVKHLLDDGKISQLDALRLNNDFRRLSGERERIERNELAVTATRLVKCENALSAVELELIYGARDDQYDFENLEQSLPDTPEVRGKAQALFEEMERKKTKLLYDRRATLQKLAERAEGTHEQVLKRLKTLEEHFTFIKTHLFWVRDQEPLGVETLEISERELTQVSRAVWRTAEEFGDVEKWDRVSLPFVGAAVALVVSPWPLYRLRRALKMAGRHRRHARRAAALVATAASETTPET
jgi:hypothetical protein